MTRRSIVTSLLAVGATLALSGCPLFGPRLSVSTSAIHIPAAQTTATFSISNTGSRENLVVALSTTEGWLSASFDGLPIPPGGQSTVTVAIDRDYSDLKSLNVPDFATGDVVVQSSVGTASVKVSTAPNYFTQSFASGEFDLDGKQLTFTPDGSLSFYFNQIADGLLDFPVDPAGGALLPFSDPAWVATYGDPVAVVPFGGATVPFYGENFDTLYISSSGYVGFGEPGSAPTDLASHFASPKVSGLAVDGDDATAEVSVRQTENGIIITFEDAPTQGQVPLLTNRNDFQIELLFDGTIKVSYVDIDPDAEGVVGLSVGTGNGLSTPDGFFESDLSTANTKALAAAL